MARELECIELTDRGSMENQLVFNTGDPAFVLGMIPQGKFENGRTLTWRYNLATNGAAVFSDGLWSVDESTLLPWVESHPEGTQFTVVALTGESYEGRITFNGQEVEVPLKPYRAQTGEYVGRLYNLTGENAQDVSPGATHIKGRE